MSMMRRHVASAFALFASLFLAGPVLADQVVYLINGKAMTVKKVEKGDRITTLEIEGGGRIGIPTELIQRIEELQLSNQAAVAAPAAQAVPAAGTVPQPQNAATETRAVAVSPQGAGAPVGPMTGGKAANPNASLAGLKALPVGGADGDAPADDRLPNAPPRPGTQAGAGAQAGPGMATPPLPGGRPDAMNIRPGTPQSRRFGARGGAYGRLRPPTYPPQQGSAAAAGSKPPQAPAGQATAAAPAPPPTPPAAEPPADDPPPDEAAPTDPGDGSEAPPADPSAPPDEPPADGGSPET